MSLPPGSVLTLNFAAYVTSVKKSTTRISAHKEIDDDHTNASYAIDGKDQKYVGA